MTVVTRSQPGKWLEDWNGSKDAMRQSTRNRVSLLLSEEECQGPSPVCGSDPEHRIRFPNPSRLCRAMTLAFSEWHMVAPAAMDMQVYSCLGAGDFVNMIVMLEFESLLVIDIDVGVAVPIAIDIRRFLLDKDGFVCAPHLPFSWIRSVPLYPYMRLRRW
ncbi:hypothetical protein OPV22_022274 [Ensete ventricosum]|uniref:Uncharacterized protein n=1 Tax=Ensete ventricosum TaxID=4639 RepID=A0AAV8QQE6_ENSVE|nr:hypothetical protein OPV22_022274 [Ensete ventricosum]